MCFRTRAGLKALFFLVVSFVKQGKCHYLRGSGTAHVLTTIVRQICKEARHVLGLSAGEQAHALARLYCQNLCLKVSDPSHRVNRTIHVVAQCSGAFTNSK